LRSGKAVHPAPDLVCGMRSTSSSKQDPHRWPFPSGHPIDSAFARRNFRNGLAGFRRQLRPDRPDENIRAFSCPRRSAVCWNRVHSLRQLVHSQLPRTRGHIAFAAPPLCKRVFMLRYILPVCHTLFAHGCGVCRDGVQRAALRWFLQMKSGETAVDRLAVTAATPVLQAAVTLHSHCLIYSPVHHVGPS